MSDHVSLKEYFHAILAERAAADAARVAALDQRLAAVLAERDKGDIARDTAMDQRLASMNEFRAQLTTQAARFIQREEHDLLAEEIKAVRLVQAGLVQREDLAPLRDDIGKIEVRQSAMLGRMAGAAMIIGALGAFVGVVAAVMGVWHGRG